MPVKVDVQQAAFIATTLLLFLGTVYSVKNNTYLDTSDPFLTNLPHHLHKTDYFANKSNILNVWFIKRAWGWTSFAFLFLWLTSPRHTQTMRRAFLWAVETLAWLVFTSWFFGPALIERLIAASGGECTVFLPSGAFFPVPHEYCFTKSPLSPLTHASLFATPLILPEIPWSAVPRLRRGHDVSGHIFLLTMSVLFLTAQLKPSLRATSWPPMHKWAVLATTSLIVTWLFAIGTTSVYFHTPIEKFTGYLLGLAGYGLTLLF
ncbi:Fat storage-inducing transmembrane protein [Melanogaster broomeanus]|nr:Fat storage-inducing transmembrane protein [Melanogaster broomeanus]